MKIIHELNQLDYGGVERVIRNLIKYDDKNDHTIISYKEGPFRKELEQVGARVVVLGEDEEGDFSADVIHVHTGGAPSNMAKQLAGMFPIVETIHSPVRSAMRDEIVTQRIGVCHAVTAKNTKCKTIHNGLDFEDLKPKSGPVDLRESHGISAAELVIGRLGRLGTDKGLEEFILTCYKLQQKGLEFRPVIVGGEANNCEGYRGKLKLMCESLPLKGVVWVDHTDNPGEWHNAFNIFLYPSATEGFGLVYAEAMYFGRTVVAWDTPVTKELFGGHALLAKLNDIDDLAKQTEKAMSTDIQDEFYGLNHDWVVQEYNAQRMSGEYQTLYEQLCLDFNSNSQNQKEHAVCS